MSPRIYGNGEPQLTLIVGEIAGQIEMMRDENKRMMEDNRRLLEKLDKVQSRVSDIDNKMEPLPRLIEEQKTAIAGHTTRIVQLELFDGKIAIIIAIIWAAASAVGTGLWMIFANFGSVLTAIKRFFLGYP